jgi:hypothetical protein
MILVDFGVVVVARFWMLGLQLGGVVVSWWSGFSDMYGFG